MKKIFNLLLIIFPIIFYCQNLHLKILKTELIKKDNVKIKILIENNSNNIYEYTTAIEIRDIKKNVEDDFTNLIAFYKNEKWINIPTMHYGKYSIKKNHIIKIKPYSKKIIIINLKKNLSKERKRGLYLTLHLQDLKTFDYHLSLYFKNSQNNKYERYELSGEVEPRSVTAIRFYENLLNNRNENKKFI